MDVVKGSWSIQQKVEDRIKRMGKGKYGRVLKMARKPDSEEFTKVVQITGIGIILIGALGFLIYLIWTFVPPWIAEALGL
ncbi:protein translocase SEC61 complex subunit gamma [[Eubacterium] cellulosolvens]